MCIRRPCRHILVGIILPILVITILIEGCSSSSAAIPDGGSVSPPTKNSVDGLVQSSSGGAVTIDVRWLAGTGDSIVFDVFMDTHSVNLDSYDLKKLTVLRDDHGSEYQPILWSSAPGGHHRSGKLSFPLPTSVSQGTAKYVELSIRDIAGVKERVLKWEPLPKT